MSEQENQPTPPAQPTAKTSTVPLKKETVRITLRAKPGAGTPSAPAPPSAGAPAPPRPPSPPAAPGAPAPPRPAMTAPLAAGAPKPPAGAKTIPLTSAPMPRPPGGAPMAQPTAKLSTPGAPAGPGTRPMPKATVQLQPTQPVGGRPTGPARTGPLTGPIQTGAIKSAAASQLMDDSSDEEGGVMPFAIICLVLAVAVLCIQLFSSQAIFPTALPAEKNPNDKQNPTTGDWLQNLQLKEIPEAPKTGVAN